MRTIALLLALVSLPTGASLAIPFSNLDAFTYEGLATQGSRDAEADWMNGVICGSGHGLYRRAFTLEVLAGAPPDALRLTIATPDHVASALARPDAPATLAWIGESCDIPTFWVDGQSVTAAAAYRVTMTSERVSDE